MTASPSTDWKLWRVRIVTKFPIITTVLLESANTAQLWRMWTERSALGQSILGWSLVNAALWMWFIYYKILLPDQKLVHYCQALGIVINFAVIGTACYFRLLGQ